MYTSNKTAGNTLFPHPQQHPGHWPGAPRLDQASLHGLARGRRRLTIWVCPRRGLVGVTGIREEELLFPKNQALVIGWHVHLGEMLWLKKQPP